MERQLVLLDTPREWRLDAATREVGRRGLADARAALNAARRPPGPPPPDGPLSSRRQRPAA